MYLSVAIHLGRDMRAAWASAGTVAAMTGKSESQVKHDLAELVKLGFLAPR